MVRPEAGVRMMTADEVVVLASSSLVEIGSHTINHTVLGDADEALAYGVMIECRERLEDLLGVPVPSSATPAACIPPSARMPRGEPVTPAP